MCLCLGFLWLFNEAISIIIITSYNEVPQQSCQQDSYEGNCLLVAGRPVGLSHDHTKLLLLLLLMLLLMCGSVQSHC